MSPIGILDSAASHVYHRESEKELREIHGIRRLYSCPEYERTLQWVENALQKILDVQKEVVRVTSPIPHPVLPKTVPMIVGNGDGGIRVTDVVTVDLPPISRENVKDRGSGIYRALQPMLLHIGSDIRREEVLCLLTEIEADLQSQSQATSYPKLLRQAFFILTRQLGVLGTLEEEDAFVTSIASWDLFPDSIRAVATMCTQFRLVAITNVDQTTYEFSRRIIDPGDILSGAITVTYRLTRSLS